MTGLIMEENDLRRWRRCIREAVKQVLANLSTDLKDQMKEAKNAGSRVSATAKKHSGCDEFSTHGHPS